MSKYVIQIIAILIIIGCTNDNKNQIVLTEFNELELTKLKNVGDSQLFRRLTEISNKQNNILYPLKLKFYCKVKNDSILDYLFKEDEEYYKIYNSSQFENTEKRIITNPIMNFSSKGILTNKGYSVCQYIENVREGICYIKTDSSFIYLEYQNDLPNGEYIEINESTNTTTLGQYKSFFNTNQFETIDTFVEFDKSTFEEKIFVKHINGKSLKEGNWEIWDGSNKKIVKYQSGEKVDK